MLESYKISKSNNEEILYLYLNVSYEFASDLEEDSLEKKARSYIVTHNIKFNGNKIIFIINGISTKMITINNIKSYLNDYLITLNNEEKITLKELLLSLLFSNINISLNEETLKALTVLYRNEIIYNLIENTLDLRKLSLSYHNYNYYKVNCYKLIHEDIIVDLIKNNFVGLYLNGSNLELVISENRLNKLFKIAIEVNF